VGLTEGVSTLFESEWDRFTKGIAQLDPQSFDAAKLNWQRARAGGDQVSTINVPNISDVFHFGAPIAVTQGDYVEFRSAQRQGREPNLSAPIAAEVARRIAVSERIATSAQPDYGKAFGTVLTATDNVQDFFSTVATAGRLGLWGLEKSLNALVPGAVEAVASAAAKRAAIAAAAAAGEAFLRGLLAEAALGNPLAIAALADRAALAATIRGVESQAAKLAASAAFRYALLGLGSRIALKLIPVVGWVVLVGDLLNLMSLLFSLATPIYALLCAGPRAALAGGMPAVVFKRALKAEAWTMASLNPFSRQARSARALRSAGRLPTFSNLIEVAQVTDSLYGFGLSLGGLVGLMQESVYAALGLASGKNVVVNTSTPFERPPAWAVGVSATDSPVTIQQKQQAARVIGTAPIMQAVQEVFTEEEHLSALLALDGAIGVIQADLKGRPWQETLAERSEQVFTAPLYLSAVTRAILADMGLDPEDGRRWPIPGTPRAASGRELVEYWQPRVTATVTEFLEPRRNTLWGALYGGLVNQTMEKFYFMFEEDSELLKFELTPDWKLIIGMIEDGVLIEPRNEPKAVWRLWLAARGELEARGNRPLKPGRWLELGHEFGVTMVPLLPPEAPFSPEILDLVKGATPPL
jgi:hypothetical protein